MAHSKLYRNFIILQEDERGYSHSSDKVLSGYAKVEAKGDKCKISFYAQNLKQEDNYSMVLICCKRDLKQLIDLGPLSIDGVGKGDTGKEYYVNNIAGLGISYDKISGAAICKAGDNGPEFVMHGFMNGEDSTDNWRKYKMVKVDSKKYINKSEVESKKKEIYSSDEGKRDVISNDNSLKSKITETPKSEIIADGSKKEVSNLESKENIAVEGSDGDSFNLEHKQQNRVPEEQENTSEVINVSDDRHKCKEDKKCDKHHECEEDKHDKCEKAESIEESIIKLGKKLDSYHGVIDFKINNIHEDVTIYGFIKDKNDCDCKWKKFKVETIKCRFEEERENDDFNYVPFNSRKIEENFKLDGLNRMDRLDIIDFDEYENEIKQMGKVNGPQAGNGMMNEAKETPNQMNMAKGNQMNNETIMPTTTENMVQPKKTPIEQTTQNQVEQPTAPTQQFNISGEIGLYFEKIAEDFEPYESCLSDINYCKLYKINVYSIDQLSDDSNYNKYTLAYYPMLNYYPYISKEGHYLLGYKCNKNGELKYIVYAIPGDKEKSCQPYGGRTGFVTWTTDKKNGKGYWLMFYDFKNSSIVIPTK
ncbi:hypothetical protein [Clostridium sp. C2-6-12]|uniref:DUF7922 domain-containing protein n=1 Tax=Clostridium sp. C2-6-12 TaxID=2698832 RepID=UPI001368C749|nr:hypothetical protein [Clostridium sp. C2-6-12]